MKNVTVYAMENCPYCVKAKALLTQRGVKFETIMIDDWADDKWDAFVKKNGMKTVPQIFVDDKLVGGYTQLEDADQKGEVKGWK